MKTVKKLFSLLLVAVLLFSAVPFQASAETEENVENKTYIVSFTYRDASNAKQIVGTTNGEVPADGKVTITVPAFNGTAPEGKKFAGWKVPGMSDLVNPGSLVLTKTGNFTDTERENKSRYTCGIEAVFTDLPHEHKYSETGTVTPPTCTANGYTTYACEGEGCNATRQGNSTPPAGHSFGNWGPAANQVGVQTRSCSVCGFSETKSDSISVTFESVQSNQVWEKSFAYGQTVTANDLPTPNKVKGKTFKGWETQNGVLVSTPFTYDGLNNYYKARFVDGDDGLSTISVYARFYVDGVQQGSTTYLYSQDFNDGDNVLSWLQNHESTTYNAIFGIKSADEYDWSPRYYYDYSGNEPLTSQELTANGDKSIVVKVYANSSAKARVMLYVHNKVNNTPSAIYEMKGYTAGNTVTLSAAQTTIKNATGKTYTLTGLYTDEAWAQLNAGQKPTAANGVYVDSNDLLVLHVISGSYTTSSAKADSTNPATGDFSMIEVTACVMVLAAAALVVMMQLRKRKMI